MPTETEHSNEARIHIDQEPRHSPNPTTGAALYLLGKVQPGLELFREVTGDREDPEVTNGPGDDSSERGRAFPQWRAEDLQDLLQRPGEGGYDEDRNVRADRRAGFSQSAHRAEHALHGGIRGRSASKPVG